MKRTCTTGKIQGFALPTVMIASVVMLMVLLSGLGSASSVNNALRSQYNNKLAIEAAEAGAAMAEACLKKNNYSSTVWTVNPLRPNTDCAGTAQAGYSCPVPAQTTLATEPRCAVVESPTVRTTFEVSPMSGSATEKFFTVKATVYFLNQSNRTLRTSTTVEKRHSVIFKDDPSASRPTKRYWFFGVKSGLDFGVNGTGATTMVAPCLATCTAAEGTTAIATKTGLIQFWTDGRTIWARNGSVMPNGTGLNSSSSSTQAAAVFPLGADETKYVVVSNNTEHNVNNAGELYYSIVDMTLNGGLGDVTATKNVQAWTSTFDYASEASTSAPKSDGSGYWVITFTPGTTHVRVISFDNSGTPTGVTTYNAPTGIVRFSTTLSGYGTMNFNNDYSKLVMMAGNHCSPTCSNSNGLVRLMSFNTSTGAVTNINMWNNYTTEAASGYSADFSPSGNYVYTSTLYPGRLTRYNISGTPSDATIKASEWMIGGTQPGTATSCTGGGQVLRAPNGKMYVANCGTTNISVIGTPDATSNTAGAIGWVYNGITLAAGTESRYGLPQVVTIYSPRIIEF